MKLATTVGALLLATLITPALAITPAGMRLVSEAIGPCSNPCVVASNNGGKVKLFRAAGEAIRHGAGQMLVIDGYCASSCMVLADRARPRACITSRAVFAYHKTNWNRPIPLGSDLDHWVRSHGGYPEFSGTPGVMSNEVAQRFWRTCREVQS